MTQENTEPESTPTTPEAKPVEQRCLVRELREMRDVQGSTGNWSYDPYMHGMYNGMEYALAIMEEREPEFKDAPDEWLADGPSIEPTADSIANVKVQSPPTETEKGLNDHEG